MWACCQWSCSLLFFLLLFEYLHVYYMCKCIICSISCNLHSSMKRYCYLRLTGGIQGMESLVKDKAGIQVSESRVQDLKYSIMIISSSLPILVFTLPCIKIWKQNRKGLICHSSFPSVVFFFIYSEVLRIFIGKPDTYDVITLNHCMTSH